MPGIGLINQRNKSKKKTSEILFPNNSNEFLSCNFRNSHPFYPTNKLNTKSKSFQAKEHSDPNNSNKYKPNNSESFEYSNTNKSSNSNVFTKVFSRLESNRYRSPSASTYSFSNLNTSSSSKSSFSSRDQLEFNTDKSKFRSSLSPKYLKKQKSYQSSTIKENYFEPIVDNILDDDESTLINADKDSPNSFYRASRKTNRKSKVYPQPLTKLPVYDFGRTFSSDFRDNENDKFHLKMIPLKRSLTLENSKRQNIFQQQEKYFQSFHVKRNPTNEYARATPEYYNQHLKDYFNSNMYGQHRNTSNKTKTYNVVNDQANINLMTSQMFRKMSTTTTTATSIPKKTNAIGFYNYNNKKNMYKEYAAFCTCNSSKINSAEANNYMNISDNRYMDHNTLLLNNSRTSRKITDVKKNRIKEYSPDFSTKNHRQKNVKSNDFNLNLNNVLKNNPYKTYLNVDSSDYSEDDENVENKFEYDENVGENYFKKKGVSRSILKSFHRPHSSIQFENQEIGGNGEYFDNSINSELFMSSHYKSKLNHFNLANKAYGVYDLNNVSLFGFCIIISLKNLF